MKNLSECRCFTIFSASIFLAACGGLQQSVTEPLYSASRNYRLHQAFPYTGVEQFFSVPRGVTMIEVKADGAGGGMTGGTGSCLGLFNGGSGSGGTQTTGGAGGGGYYGGGGGGSGGRGTSGNGAIVIFW